MTREERALLHRASAIVDQFPWNRRSAVFRGYERLAHAITHGHYHQNGPCDYQPWPPVQRTNGIPPPYTNLRRVA